MAKDETSSQDKDPTEALTESLENGRTTVGEIGPYRLIARVGEGGMGEVFKAVQTEPIRRTVALKVIKRGMDSREIVARFEAERQALALMSHANVARVLDAGETTNGRPYFVMEFVDGVPITTYCDRHSLDIPQRLELFVQVCDGVQHAHHKAIIHRDLKPSNVLVSLENDRPVPKIIDFGLAKAVSQQLTDRPLLTHHGQLVGTPEFMSPEQVDTSGVDVDTRTDVYSLGVLLYDLVAGELPFDRRELTGSGLVELQRRIREEDPPPPSKRVKVSRASSPNASRDTASIARQLKGDLDCIVMKALEKDRRRRYQSPAELAADLQRFLNHEPVLARPATTAYRLSKWARRNRAAAAAGLVAGLSVVFAVSTLAWSLISVRHERNEARRQAAIAEAVNKFLNEDLLSSVDPLEGGNRNTTVREVVAAALERLDGKFAGEPAVEASIRKTLSRTLDGLGDYEGALEQALRVLDLERRAGRGRAETLEAMLDVGYMYAQLARYEEAEPYLREAYEGYRVELGEEHKETLTALNNLAYIYGELGDWDRAATHHRQLLRLREATLGEAHPHTLISVNNLASALRQLDQSGEAMQLFERAAALAAKVHGEQHPEAITAWTNLASILKDVGRYEESLEWINRAYDAALRSLGEEHPVTLDALATLGDVQLSRGEIEKGTATLETALARRRAVQDLTNPSLVSTVLIVARARTQRDQAKEALDLVDEVLAAHAEASAETSWRVDALRAERARALAALGSREEAEGILLAAHRNLVEALGARSPVSRRVRQQLVALYEDTGRSEEAARWRQ